jgi:hypothetical protein
MTNKRAKSAKETRVGHAGFVPARALASLLLLGLTRGCRVR